MTLDNLSKAKRSALTRYLIHLFNFMIDKAKLNPISFLYSAISNPQKDKYEKL